MKIIALMAQKGGVGKTTLAVHLAVQAGGGRHPLDADPQGSAKLWHEQRSADAPLLAQAEAGNLKSLLKSAEGEGAETVIIDAPPHNEKITGDIAALADLVVIPCRPTILDLNAIGSTVATVLHRGARGVVVLSACPPRRTLEANIVSEARKFISKYGLPVYPGQVTQRVAFSHSLIGGQAVTEFEPKGKAADEIRKLWNWLRKEM